MLGLGHKHEDSEPVSPAVAGVTINAPLAGEVELDPSAVAVTAKEIIGEQPAAEVQPVAQDTPAETATEVPALTLLPPHPDTVAAEASDEAWAKGDALKQFVAGDTEKPDTLGLQTLAEQLPNPDPTNTWDAPSEAETMLPEAVVDVPAPNTATPGPSEPAPNNLLQFPGQDKAGSPPPPAV